MTTPLDAASLVVELLSWIGLCLGIPLLIAGYVRRLAFSGWTETMAVIVARRPVPDAPRGDTDDTHVFRWLGDDGHLYELPADTEETAHLVEGDDVTVFVNPRRPEQARTDPAHREGHLLRLLGYIFAGVGVVSVVLSIVIAVVE
ncbi:DUF3592 domain-containing protein [Agreia sp. Leaf210]|uniref:DUF3592 domain-containing protein n=1 Tax=Agreia sp. Leaf210 TaxID=1735682 RepID=UPI0006FED912|nr:DUF3592 domain-containing protein [Agreia sp. Leaf210]KQM57113.1 hypothetical protein ASE64_16990 [Agreia sp. Leaf210]